MKSSATRPTTATIQVPALVDGDLPKRITASVQGFADKRLTLIGREHLRSGTVLSVECEDTLLLGEVIASSQLCDESWCVEILVEQILTGLQSLMLLRSRLLGEAVPERERVDAQAARR